MNAIPQTFEEVKAEIERFCKAHEHDGFGIMPGYEFGHIVIDDYNLEDGYIQWCIGRADRWEEEEVKDAARNYPDSFFFACATKAIRKYKVDLIVFLQWLLTIPEDVRIIWDDDQEYSLEEAQRLLKG